MQRARKPRDEARRLASLRDEAVLDTGPEASFDRISRTASAVFGGMHCYVSFLDEARLWVKAGVGVETHSGAPRSETFGDHVVRQKGVLWVEDARADARFVGNAFVTSVPFIRFYAGAPIHSADGRRVGALGVFSPEPLAFDAIQAAQLQDLAGLASDILAMRRNRREIVYAEEARDRAEALAQGMIAHSPVAMAMFDRDMNYVRVSPRWAREFLTPAAALVGRNLYSDDPGSLDYAPLHRRALEGETVAGEGAMPLKDGSLRYSRYEVCPWFDAAGRIGGVLLTSIDVSSLVLARETAQNSERRLQLALDIADTVVWEAVRADRSMHISGPWEKLFPTRPTYDSIMRDAIALVHPADQGDAAAAWERHLKTGAPYNVEHRQKTADDSVLWVRSQAEACYDGHGRLERVIGVAKDITAAKRAEREYAEARAAAEDANRAKSEFLANMSHELRTPLNGVAGVASALARTPLGPQQREMVGLIESSAATLDRLLGDVLDLARVESGRLEIRSEPFDLAGLVDGVATLFHWRARDKGVAFTCRIAPELAGRWMGDAVRVRQVLTNLVSNAVKFTAMGSVEISAQLTPGGRVALAVADTGIGFDEVTKTRLFERFVQADGSITRRFGGTGLGLAIARTLAVRMNGALSAHSEPGRGSTFTLELPLGRASTHASPALEAPAPETPAAGERRLRVLLAEDHPTNRRVVELILAAIDADLVSVEDGGAAVEAAAAQVFDVILMDMQMPVMDGLTALRAIRRREAGRGQPRTPAVILTANALPEHVQAALDAGADEHLAKPVTAAALLEVVARVAKDAGAEPLLRTG